MRILLISILADCAFSFLFGFLGGRGVGGLVVVVAVVVGMGVVVDTRIFSKEIIKQYILSSMALDTFESQKCGPKESWELVVTSLSTRSIKR